MRGWGKTLGVGQHDQLLHEISHKITTTSTRNLIKSRQKKGLLELYFDGILIDFQAFSEPCRNT